MTASGDPRPDPGPGEPYGYVGGEPYQMPPPGQQASTGQPTFPAPAGYPGPGAYPGPAAYSDPAAYSGTAAYSGGAGYPPTGYPGPGSPYAPQPPMPPKPSKTVPALLGVLIALLVIGGGYLGFRLLDDGDSATTAQPGDTVTQNDGGDGTGNDEGAAPAPAMTPLEELRAQSQADHSQMSGSLNGRWAAQLSSKQEGLYAENKTWTAAEILAEHQELRSRFGQARLLWSADWPVFSYNDWWVTVYAGDFSGPNAANAWCRSNGFDRDHCFAKLIRTTGGAEGTTVYWK